MGKTLVSSSMIDRVAEGLGRELLEVPVGFKWFVPGLLDGSVAFGGEESAGASFLQRDGSVWTTDKDGIILALLASEITAVTGHSPSELYRELTSRYGDPAYARIDTAASREQKAALAKLSPEQVSATELAGEPITAALTTAPGNGAPIGGLKVVAASGWFAARPSGTEDVYKLYAESFRGPGAPRRHPGPGPRDHRRRDRRLLTGAAAWVRMRSPHELHIVFTRVPPAAGWASLVDLAGRDGLMVRRAGAGRACGPAPDTPRAAALGRRSPCLTSLPRYQRTRTARPGCPPCSHSRTRLRTGRSAPVCRRGGGRERARRFAVPRHRPAIDPPGPVSGTSVFGGRPPVQAAARAMARQKSTASSVLCSGRWRRFAGTPAASVRAAKSVPCRRPTRPAHVGDGHAVVVGGKTRLRDRVAYGNEVRVGAACRWSE